MALIKPTQLRKISDGRVFAYTDALAKRADMVPVWTDGVDPNIAAGNLTEEQIEESKEGQLRAALAEKSRMLLEKDKQIDDLTKQVMDRNDEIAKLNALVVNLKNADAKAAADAEESAAAADQEDPDRQEKIREAVKAILEERNPNNFTGSGRVRIEAIEALSELTGISAAERDAAMEAFSE